MKEKEFHASDTHFECYFEILKIGKYLLTVEQKDGLITLI